jgi:ATP-dependent Clp protease ATP-binding subunit ClpA
MPYTSRAKKILELAMSEARQLEHNYVGTERLLLGTIAEEKGIAAQVLADAGVTLEAARAETLRVLAGKSPDERARRVVGLGFGEARRRRTAIGARASELVRELAGQSSPDAAGSSRDRADGTTGGAGWAHLARVGAES